MVHKPLEGIRVIDWGLWWVGPGTCGILSTLGADVIKIETREGGDPNRNAVGIRGIPTLLPNGNTIQHEAYNWNRKSITVDLKRPEGKEIAYRLVEKSDVFVQNFRPGTAENLKMDYKTLCQYNPKIVYGTGSGFGLKGPEARRPAMDFLGVARSGIMFTAKGPNEPPQVTTGGLADDVESIFLTLAIMTALYTREKFGFGQEVDVSHLSSMMNVQRGMMAVSLLTGQSDPGVPDRRKAPNPIYNTYQCKDGKWLVFGHFQPDPWWPNFCQAVGLEPLIRDPRFKDYKSREKNNEELIKKLDVIFIEKTRAEWTDVLNKNDLIWGEVNTLTDLHNDPQVLANDYIVDFDHPTLGPIKTLGMPMKFSKTPGVAIHSRAPELGEHTEDILVNLLDYSWEEVSSLRDDGII
jgi:crotonobetainyl-CoA:carnitine CoA-transferase CaiB-like acyl-CoA transferase